MKLINTLVLAALVFGSAVSNAQTVVTNYVTVTNTVIQTQVIQTPPTVVYTTPPPVYVPAPGPVIVYPYSHYYGYPRPYYYGPSFRVGIGFGGHHGGWR